ncbi:hypothetical protein PFNF135_02810 [Plasmodium falciparum NF135/5.C10]|uniref:Uncharacterized protein n=1 Tax=Plasmodium falciparum NF135/5.C10 TaxID=1036726 RepID=W4IGW0_PLAFA|nr:hypothetical protein PFNF135_02810 [Plasmodium falciparum NF135/5.C10]
MIEALFLNVLFIYIKKIKNKDNILFFNIFLIVTLISLFLCIKFLFNNIGYMKYNNNIYMYNTFRIKYFNEFIISILWLI